MSWENDLRTTLKGLEVPEHGPEFWAELDLRLEDSNLGRRLGTPKRGWRAPVGIVAALAAALVVLMIALPTSLTSTVLAYSYPEGTYTYDISYFEAHHTETTGEGAIEAGPPVSTEAHGTLTYTIEEGPDEGTKTIGVQANVSDVNVDCGHPSCANDINAFQAIPEVRFVVDSNGGLLQALAPDSGEEFPALVLPDPLPGSNLYGGLPFGFGPPFPEQPLDVGDSWTTGGPRSVFDEDGPQFTADHKVVGKETIADRDTMVINSVYQTPGMEVADHRGDGASVSIAEAFFGPETAEVTVWFDPAEGIIVRAELDRATTSEAVYQNGQILTSNGTTRIVVELIAER
jgi:hypothetical protein